MTVRLHLYWKAQRKVVEILGKGATVNLKTILDLLYENRSLAHLANDPLSFCHGYADPLDREVAGLIGSSLSYGNVKAILANLESVFARMTASPRRYIENFDPVEGLKEFSWFRYRFHDCQDLCALFLALRTMIHEAGSIQNYFAACHDPDAPDITSSLTEFTASVLRFDYSNVFGCAMIPENSYLPHFFPSPARGSACKRLCMYLRWMVRPADGIDLGLWSSVLPSQLIIPVDAHIRRISGLLGLTSRRQADWRMALEVTDALRKMDPRDPVKYDFSLCHLGISEGCNGADRTVCMRCAISDVCRGSGN